MWNLRRILSLGGANRGAALFGVAAFAILAMTVGCDDNNNQVVAVDAVPFTVDGVYSVTGDHEVTVYWRPNQELDISYYKVYRNNAPTGTFTLVGSSPGTSFVDATVTNGVTYYYAVAAVDNAGQESAELSYENVFDTPRPEGFNALITNALVNDAVSGWDFSAFTPRTSLDARTDIWYEASNGHYLVYTPTDTQIQDAGYVALRDVDYGPPSGWSADGVVEAIVGHSYIVLTRDGNYAKFEVVARGTDSVTFDWAYQVDTGNPELARGVKR
ncbi:MAG TPA: hypothetical protein VFS09_07235 [Candidatus Eisenbacteria bacterium]|nr:hypothetical protein [Candidatus Eisenbacteria bacterium]